jgi:Tfp pilus assembly protein PilF
MSQEKPLPRGPRVELLVAAAVAVLTLLVYARSYGFEFVKYDDPVYVVYNPHVETGLTADGVRWAFTTFDCGNWHPLTWLSLQLDATLYGGLKPGFFHLTNVLLHAANAVLLFLVLGRLTGAVWRSAVVAALFALHPLHVESVAWVAERKDVLSTLFWMLTLVAYLGYVRRPGVGRYLLVALALALGLMAKPMLVTLPCVLLLLDYWPLRRRPAVSWPRLVIEKLPLFGLVVASCVVTVIAQREGQAVAPLAALPLAARIGNALLAYVGYLGMMLWPVHLAVYYPHPGTGVSVGWAVAAGLLLAAVTALVLGPGRRRPYLAVGWLWYLGTLVPVIGLVQVGGQALADRYTYVPLIGVFLLLTWGAADLATAWRLPRSYPAATAALVLFACAVLTEVQLGYWLNNLELWKHAAAVTDRNVLAHINLGTCYNEAHMLTAARKEFETAVAIDPKVAEAHNNLGQVLGEIGLPERAAAEYRQATALTPGLSRPHFNLGTVLAELGRPEEAVKEVRAAIALEPANASFHNSFGGLLWDLGRPEEAEAEYRTAIDLDPRDAYPHRNLGMLLLDLGRRQEALPELRQAVTLDPENAELHRNLGRALREEGQLEEAAAEYRKALEMGDKQAVVGLWACERMQALRPRLPGLIAGQDRPADDAERLAFADLCRQPGEGRYALAARLYADAFRAEPRLADDLGAAYRFHAAVAAAAAGCGQGQDGAGLDEAEKARLRSQALEWLRADLALWTRQVRPDVPQARAAVRQQLRLWQHDPGLAGVRDPAALARRTEGERAVWQKLWQEVGELLAQARSPHPKPPGDSGSEAKERAPGGPRQSEGATGPRSWAMVGRGAMGDGAGRAIVGDGRVGDEPAGRRSGPRSCCTLLLLMAGIGRCPLLLQNACRVPCRAKELTQVAFRMVIGEFSRKTGWVR